MSAGRNALRQSAIGIPNDNPNHGIPNDNPTASVVFADIPPFPEDDEPVRREDIGIIDSSSSYPMKPPTDVLPSFPDPIRSTTGEKINAFLGEQLSAPAEPAASSSSLSDFRPPGLTISTEPPAILVHPCSVMALLGEHLCKAGLFAGTPAVATGPIQSFFVSNDVSDTYTFNPMFMSSSLQSHAYNRAMINYAPGTGMTPPKGVKPSPLFFEHPVAMPFYTFLWATLLVRAVDVLGPEGARDFLGMVAQEHFPKTNVVTFFGFKEDSRPPIYLTISVIRALLKNAFFLFKKPDPQHYANVVFLRTNVHLAFDLDVEIKSNPKECPPIPSDAWVSYRGHTYVALTLEYFLAHVAFPFLLTFGQIWAKNGDVFM